MNTKFDQIYQKLMADIQITENSIKNINEMSNQEFVQFLLQLIPLFKNKTLDLNKLSITQYISNCPMIIIWIDNDIFFEYKQKMMKWNQFKIKDMYQWIYNHLKPKFQQKYSNIEFKIIGQYFSEQLLRKNNTITPIASQYMKDKFGSHGLLQIYDIRQLDTNQSLDYFKQFRDLSDSELRIQFDELIKKLQFVLDTNNLQEFIKVINKSTYNRAVKSAINEMRRKLISQLKQLINNVYITINGTKYSFNNPKDQLNNLQNQFLKKIFGYSNRKQISNIQNPSKYVNKWKQNYTKFVDNYGKLLNKLKSDDNILEGQKFTIYQQGKDRFEKLYTIKTFTEYLNSLKDEKI